VYLKHCKHRAIQIDCHPSLIDHGSLHSPTALDFSAIYPDAAKEIDSLLPTAKGIKLEITVVIDADHAHDRKFCHSILGIIVFVGHTPVVWISKWQGSVQALTYGAEFNAMCMAIEEILSICYSLHSFGMPFTHMSCIFSDNMSVLLNIQQPDSQLHKKHLAVSYHVSCESCAARIIEPFYILLNQN
jgi:hypothetical protein